MHRNIWIAIILLAIMLAERRKALEIYKELIEELEGIRNPVYNWQLIVQELEDKYYPKLKNTRDKFNDIIRKVIKYELHDKINEEACTDITESLAELREEIEKGGNQ